MALRNQANTHVLVGLSADKPVAVGSNIVEGTFFFDTFSGVLSILKIVGGVRSWVVVGSGALASGVMKFSGTVAQNTAAGLFLSDSSGVAGVATRPGYVFASARSVQNMIVNVTSAGGAGTDTTVTLFKNGVATAMTVHTALNSGPVVLSSAGPVAFAANDTFDIQVAGAADGGATRTVAVTFEYVSV